MVLPSWAYNMIAPVSINDVINKLALLVERTPQHNESFDITGPEIMNYKELIQRTVVLNKRLPIVDLPIIPIWVSRYWVQLISKVPKEMVYPLMNSLVHDMIPQPERTHPDISIGEMTYEESVQQALDEENEMNENQNKSKNHLVLIVKNKLKMLEQYHALEFQKIIQWKMSQNICEVYK